MQMLQGIVKLVNPRRGMIAVETEDGGYTVFELLGGYEIELGDVISGNLESLGREKFTNIRNRQTLDVFVEAVQATLVNARQLLR